MRHPPVIPGFARLVHGADYNPDQWLDRPDILDEDERLAALAHMNSWSVNIFGWTALEPEEGRYTFDWLDAVMDRMARRGMRAVLATPSGARPMWMGHKYPEINRVTPDGRREKPQRRHNHCWTSPVYRGKVADINRRLAERYGKHPALGVWHLSNEYGGECHCDLCFDAFRAWLRQRYGTLDALNAAWWTAFWSHRYTAWEEIECIDPFVTGMALDWRRFVSDQAADFIVHEIRALREHSAAPALTNLMGLYPPLDYRRLAPVLDAISWDAYPTFLHRNAQNADAASYVAFAHDLTRGLKRKPFLLMESSPGPTNWQTPVKLTRPGLHALKSWQAVAHGSDSVQYFQFRKGRGGCEQFHGAVVDHVGHEHTRMFGEVAALGEALEKLSGVVGADTPADVALVYDWETRWALDGSHGPAKALFESVVVEHYRAFWRRGIPVDVLGPKDDFSRHKLVVTPMLYLLDADTAQRLAAFVRNGGTWLATFHTAMVDERAQAWPGGWPGAGLRETFGVWVEEFDVFESGGGAALATADAGAAWGLPAAGVYRADGVCDVVHAEGAEALVTVADQFYAGSPALTRHAFGDGEAYYLGARANEALLTDLYAVLAKRLALGTALPGGTLPDGVTAQVRADGETRYVFVMNFHIEPRTVHLGDAAYRDALADDAPCPAALTLPPYGLRILKTRV